MRILAPTPTPAAPFHAAAAPIGAADGPTTRGCRARSASVSVLLAAVLAVAPATHAAAQGAGADAPAPQPASPPGAPAPTETPVTVTPLAPVTAVTAGETPTAPTPGTTPNVAPDAQANTQANTPPDSTPSATPMSEKAANQQVIEPQLDRRDVHVPHIPSNDFELGVFTGTYDTQNFGASLMGGVRAGYHITEDVFVEAVYGQTKVSDENFRQILPGGIFPTPKQTLRYYDLSVGYNIFPGEIFLARNHAKVSTVYVIAGLGTTKFDDASHETVNVGAGLRVFLADWSAIQLDVRDHVFSINLLGQPQTTQNLEVTLGMTFFF